MSGHRQDAAAPGADIDAQAFRAMIVDNMAEGLYALDRNGLVTYMNRAAELMLGWTEAELRGKPMHETTHFQRADGTRVPAEGCSLLQVRTQGRSVRILDAQAKCRRHEAARH